MICSVKISAQTLREANVPLPKDDAEDEDEFTIDEVNSNAGEWAGYLESHAVDVIKKRKLNKKITY